MKTALKITGISVGVYTILNTLSLAWIGVCANYAYIEEKYRNANCTSCKEAVKLGREASSDLIDDCWSITGNMVESVKAFVKLVSKKHA